MFFSVIEISRSGATIKSFSLVPVQRRAEFIRILHGKNPSADITF